MHVLIVFATVEDQTSKISRFAEDEIRKDGHEVTLANVDDPGEISFEDMDAVILAAPVHERRHPRTFEAFLVGQRDELVRRRTLLLSVSLSAAFPEGLEDAHDYLNEMKMRTGLNPDSEILVAGAVRTCKYDFFASQIVKHVVLRGKHYDPKAEEHEFTDWETLSIEISQFLREAKGEAPRSI